jgi:hypothetical protein
MGDPLIGVRIMGVSQLSGIVTTDVVGLTATVNIVVPGGGRYHYHCWLSDSATNPAKTLTPPSSGDTIEWDGITDANGRAVIAFANNAPSHTWYLWVVLNHISASSAITAGV